MLHTLHFSLQNVFYFIMVPVLFTFYTGCTRRKGPNFGRVFLRSHYTDITQNTYIQSWMVTEILAREQCGLLVGLRTVLRPWRHTRRIRLTFSCIPTCSSQRPWLWIRRSQCIVVGKSVDNYDTCASVFVVLFNGFMSLTSYFDVMYRY
jgi:hypothetical protein